MSEHWLYLQPRETEIIMRPTTGTGENAELLQLIQAKVNVLRNEVTLSGKDVIRVRTAHRNWQLGCEPQFKALDAAIKRHVD